LPAQARWSERNLITAGSLRACELKVHDCNYSPVSCGFLKVVVSTISNSRVLQGSVRPRDRAEACGRTGVLVALGHAALWVALGDTGRRRAGAGSVAVAGVVLGACLAIIAGLAGEDFGVAVTYNMRRLR
jgi:hypothetical protein